MNKFLRDDRVWVLARVVSDQHMDKSVKVAVIMDNEAGTEEVPVFADARTTHIERARVEAGMAVSSRASGKPYTVLAVHGDHLWCEAEKNKDLVTLQVEEVVRRDASATSTKGISE